MFLLWGPMFVTWVQYMNRTYFSPTVEIGKKTRELGCFCKKKAHYGGSRGATNTRQKSVCVCGGGGSLGTEHPRKDTPCLYYWAEITGQHKHLHIPKPILITGHMINSISCGIYSTTSPPPPPPPTIQALS